MHDFEWTTVAEGLLFPEGPVACEDGTVLVVEIARGTITRVDPARGTAEVEVEVGGGPNGLAFGPDGGLYVTNNGGCFEWVDLGGLRLPGSPPPEAWPGHGSLQRVDLATGEVTTLYTECDGNPLRAPNDLVFDAVGGLWFTDHGVRLERSSDRTALYYATTDGTSIVEHALGLEGPNGIGLSPDGATLYAAETHTGRVFAWGLAAPGVIDPSRADLLVPGGGRLLAGVGGMQLFDSLAVDGDGWVNVATLINGGITQIAPDGSVVEHVATDDPLTTNLCFGGPDGRTVWATASATGRLLQGRWPRPGLVVGR